VNTHAKVAVVLIAIGVFGIAAYKFGWPYVQERMDRQSSDAKDIKAKLVVGVDNWIGYFPLCSGELRKRMRAKGYLVQCDDDKADYPARMQRLKAGELQLAVATVDSYLLNGPDKGFPATIVAVIDESKGGDAIVAWKDKVATIDDLKRKQGLRIAFTPASPSEHLLKATSVHFDVASLRGRKDWRVEANGSPDALEKMLQKKADVAVVWEPDVTRALSQPGVVKLLGSEDVEKLIVDVLLVNRKFSQDNPEAVTALLREYFAVVRYYLQEPARLEQDVVEATKMSADKARASLKGVAWVGLGDNFQAWMGGGGGAEGLVDSIQSTARILVDNGDFKSSPIPDRDPYRIVNRQFLSQIYLTATTGTQPAANVPAAQTLGKTFKPLEDRAWAAMREVGTLKTLPVVFQSGTAELSIEGKQELDAAMENLRHYPNFRVIVKGHTGLRGAAEENLKLSQERADSVGRYLQVTYGVDPNRLRIVGYGSGRPLPRLPDESDRAYDYRLPRVELALVSEAL
jgi:outer membrane protein OmpA-like peptidoglycan-associated protein/ABC-type nitrate/sulfonate/bicarbonate transport system substrate-binding protein